MRLQTSFIAAFAVVAAPVAASDILGDPIAMGALMSEVCIPDTLDFDQIFNTASDAAKAAGLTAMLDDEKAKMFGNPAQSHLVFSRTIDSFACALTVRAPTGSKDYFETLQAEMNTHIKTTYPNAISAPGNLPSPHEEKHDWVFSVPADRHFATTVTWQVEDGVLLAIGYRQIYE